MNFLYPQVFILLLFIIYIYKSTKKITPLFISIIFMILALSRPVLTKISSNQEIDSREFIIALDLSLSMMADDLSPSRVDMAKDMIKEILNKNKKDSFSLFAFTSNALILSPFTTDHTLLLSALNSIKSKNILTHSTDLNALLKKISSLKTPTKNLLIFSDGGDSIDIQQALKVAKINHIKIYAVGMASKKGTTIKDAYNKLIRDENNHLVISRLNPDFKTLALKSGGEFFSFDNFDFSLSFADTKMNLRKKRVGYTELFYIPLFISLVLFLLYFINLPKKVLLLFPFLSSLTNAGILDWYHIKEAREYYEDKKYKKAAKLFEKVEHKTMQSELNLANSYYQSGSFKKANKIYKNLKSKDKKIKKLILFKLANTEVHLKDYDKAKLHYRQALSFGKDEDIIYNLNLIIQKHTSRRDFPAAKTKKQDEKSSPQGKNSTKNQKSKSGGGKNQSNASKSSNSNSQDIKTKSKSSSSGVFSHPLGYKAYDTINKGYINEKQPW